jgi:hypothetical protein
MNFGQRPFAYTPPTGYVSLCTTNLPEPTIADGSTAFDVALWTGNGGTQTISGLNLSPDFVWIKDRSQSSDYALFDIVRGATKRLRSNQTYAEDTNSGYLTSFNSDGFSIGSHAAVNYNNAANVGWVWDAGTSTVSNTDGSITSQVRANPTAGISIVSYTGNNASSGTIGHSLNAKPGMIIVKRRGTGGNDWGVYHSALGATKNIDLNNTGGASTTSGTWNNTEPTSSVFTVGTFNMVNASDTYIAYCFAPVEGFSAMGSYVGNGSADGPFVSLSFSPALVIIKSSSVGVGSWMLYDNTRGSSNLNNKKLAANLSGAENNSNLGGTSLGLDFLSNGFKNRNDGGLNHNSSGHTYIYIAFAEHPFKTARAR